MVKNLVTVNRECYSFTGKFCSSFGGVITKTGGRMLIH